MIPNQHNVQVNTHSVLLNELKPPIASNFFSLPVHLTKIDVKIDKCELLTYYLLPNVHKRHSKSPFISNSSHCSTTILSKHIISALTVVKDPVIKYSKTALSEAMSIIFGPLKLFRGYRKVATA